MLSFFRINDPYRLVFIFIIVLIIRIPLFWGGFDLLIPELKWLLIGEKLASGSLLYADLRDDIGPFSALIYQVLHNFFGRSQLSFQLINILLVIIQSSLFNNLLIRNKAFKENTYVPAFLYALFMSLSFDFYTLSPVLMAQTFILLATTRLFERVEAKTGDEAFHNMGFYLGVATLFYLPVFFFFLSTVVSLRIFTRTSGRRYILCLYGFIIPFLMSGLYFYIRGSLELFADLYFFSWFRLESSYFYSDELILTIIISPFLLAFLGMIKLFKARGFVNYQITLQRAMFIMSFASLFAWLSATERAPFQLIIFAVPITFYGTHYFLLLKRSFLTEMKFVLFIVLILAINISLLNGVSYLSDYKELIVDDTMNDEIDGKRALVLGSNLSQYKNASLATPYLNWQLSNEQLSKPEYFDNAVLINENFMKDLPEMIIDNEGYMNKIFEYLPELKSKYNYVKPGVYILI